MAAHGIQLIAWDASDATEWDHISKESRYANQSGPTWVHDKGWAGKTPELQAMARVEEVAARVGAPYGASRFDVFLRWLVQLQMPFILATKNPSHMRSNLKTIATPGWALSDKDMTELSALRVPKREFFGNIHPWGYPGICKGFWPTRPYGGDAT